MRIGVLGATGYIGGRLVGELRTAGHEVVCIARSPERLRDRPWFDEVEVAKGDALDQESLERAFEGLDAVYHLVHSMGHSDDFIDADRLAAGHVRDAVAAAGVGHLIYLGGLGDDDDPELSPHLRSRHEVGRILADGPVPTTELRAAVIIGSGSASFEMLRSLVEVLPVMVTPRWVHTRCQPIAIRDVLFYLVAVLDRRPADSEILDIGGPDVLTYREMMHRYADVAGLRRRVFIPIPLLTPGLSSHWVNLVTPLPIGLARPLIESQVNDVLVRPDHDIRRVIDHEPLSFGEATTLALRRIQDLEIHTSWFDAEPGHPADPYPGDPSWAGGTLLADRQEIVSSASPDELFREFCSVGGSRGWYTSDWAWRLRGLIDKLLGGVGMRRGRRHPTALRVGDAVDFFRVEALDPGRLLRLRAEMKVPGRAWLEWQVEPHGSGSLLTQRAMFHPKGVTGRAYWYALVPAHNVIFGRMAARIAAAAEAAGAGTAADGAGPGSTRATLRALRAAQARRTNVR
jgi:uncharacterized protein YbjT (DUF2867 family)